MDEEREYTREELVKEVKYFAAKLAEAAGRWDTREMADLIFELHELQQAMICKEIVEVYHLKDDRQLELIPDEPGTIN
jgi:hypothetical protein